MPVASLIPRSIGLVHVVRLTTTLCVNVALLEATIPPLVHTP
jgi:hypothetical protein